MIYYKSTVGIKKTFLITIYLLSFSLFSQISKNTEHTVFIDLDNTMDAKPILNSWGFHGAKRLVSGEMDHLLPDFGKFTNSHANYFRPHNLLDLVSIDSIESKNPIYHWEKLDKAVTNLVNNKLSLLFVLMGDPKVDGETYFNNFRNNDQLTNYKKFICALAIHLEEKYGKDQVRKWYFQTVNEPDVRDPWKDDTQAFFNYYDACSEGLLQADSLLSFGGPGTALDLSNVFKGLLEHCDKGTNYFTGERGVRIDFVSIHAKGLPKELLNREIAIVNYIRQYHPRLSKTPFMNDEADPLSGWRVPYWWRTGPWFAAFVVQNYDLHISVMQDSLKVDYLLLGNDNAYAGDWYQRTTHMHFSDPEKQKQDLFIPKPSFTFAHLLSQLGETFVHTNVPNAIRSHFGVITTTNENTITMLVYNKTETPIETGKTPKENPDSNDLQAINNQNFKANLLLKGINAKRVKVQQYLIDKDHCNPYETWVGMESPEYPNEMQLEQINESAKIPEVLNNNYDVNDNQLNLSVDMLSSSVRLIKVTILKR